MLSSHIMNSVRRLRVGKGLMQAAEGWQGNWLLWRTLQFSTGFGGSNWAEQKQRFSVHEMRVQTSPVTVKHCSDQGQRTASIIKYTPDQAAFSIWYDAYAVQDGYFFSG